MNNDELNNALLAFAKEHLNKHENVSLFFWEDWDETIKVRWLVASKDSWAQGSGDTLAAARADFIKRRSEKIADLEAKLSHLKSQ